MSRATEKVVLSAKETAEYRRQEEKARRKRKAARKGSARRDAAIIADNFGAVSAPAIVFQLTPIPRLSHSPDRLPPRARRPRLPNRRRQRPAQRPLRHQAPDLHAEASDRQRRRVQRRQQQRPRERAIQLGGSHPRRRPPARAKNPQERAVQHAPRVRASAARRGRHGNDQPGGRTPFDGRSLPLA